MLCTTDPTPSPSLLETLRRRIVDHQTLPVVRSLFSIWTIPILARVLWHPTICKITLTLSSALHLSTDSIQHMYTHPRSRIMAIHGADTICSVFLVTHLSHHSTCYFLLFHMSFINLPHARCPLLPIMFHLLSI